MCALDLALNPSAPQGDWVCAHQQVELEQPQILEVQ